MSKKTKWKVAIYTVACMIIGNIIAYIIGSTMLPVIVAGSIWALAPMFILLIVEIISVKKGSLYRIPYEDRIWILWVMMYVLAGFVFCPLIVFSILWLITNFHF